MKNYIRILTGIIFCSNFSWAQNVGIGTNNPHPSSKLEIKSDTSGLLMPRIDSPAVRINSPATGLMVYNSSANAPSYFNGSAWMNMACEMLQSFSHTRYYYPINVLQNWTVPQGVTKIWIEGWSPGANGENFSTPNGEIFHARGGASGGYGSAIIPVVPDSTLSFQVPYGGGGILHIFDANGVICSVDYLGLHPFSSNQVTSAIVLQSVPGQTGTDASFSFVQLGTNDFRKIINCGKGGSSYLGGNGGQGTVISVGLPSGSVIGYTDGYISGGVPGGGGGAGYPIAGYGGGGLLILRY